MSFADLAPLSPAPSSPTPESPATAAEPCIICWIRDGIWIPTLS